MRLIVTSQRDAAGRRMFEMLPEYGFSPAGEEFEGMPVLRRGELLAISTERELVRAEHLDRHFPDAELYVFASRHRARSELRTLSVHVTGNLGREALVGGEPCSVAIAAPGAMRVALLELERHRRERSLDYQVCLEATHHGPTELEKPLLFVEVGPGEEEWRDRRALRAVVEAALKAAACRESFPCCLGAGGSHYAPRHTELVLQSEVAVGHIIPSYAIPELEFEVFRLAVERCGAEAVHLDWKGMKAEERRKVLEMCERLGIPAGRRRQVLQRFSGRRVEVDVELLREAERADTQGFKELLRRLGLTACRSDGRLTGLRGDATPEEVVKACVELLSRRGGLSLEGDELVLRSRRMDAKRAASLGVRGSGFAELVERGRVVVQGREVRLDMVTKEEVRRVRISSRSTLEVLRRVL